MKAFIRNRLGRVHWGGGGGGGGGAVPPLKNKKINVFGQKQNSVPAKINYECYFCIKYSSGWFPMIRLITPEMNIISGVISQIMGNLTSWSLFYIEKDKKKKIKHISYVGLYLFTDVWLLALKVFPKYYLRSTVRQTRLSSIAIIYTERSCANRIFQVSMDRIIDIFGKRKNREFFMRSVHVGFHLWFLSLTSLKWGNRNKLKITSATKLFLVIKQRLICN